MPESLGATTGQLGRRGVAPVVVRRGPKRAERPQPTVAARKKMAELFTAVVGAWGGVEAVASFLRINKSNVSRMCSGEKPIAFRHFIDLFEGCSDAVVAFCQVLCAGHRLSVPRRLDSLTEAALALIVLRGLNDGSAVTRTMIENIAAQFGHDRADVSSALQGGVSP